jgi:hypothetical protein
VYAVDATVPDIEVIEVAWATVTRELRSTKIDGQFNLDVVNSAALDRYMSERVHCSATWSPSCPGAPSEFHHPRGPLLRTYLGMTTRRVRRRAAGGMNFRSHEGGACSRTQRASIRRLRGQTLGGRVRVGRRVDPCLR